MARPFVELGVAGLNEWNGIVQESWISNLRTAERKVKVFDEMSRTDPVGSTMLHTTSTFMQGASIQVKPAGNTTEDFANAEFLESCLSDMSKAFNEIMSDIVLFLVYGWFDMELVYKRRAGKNSKHDDGRIGWKKWAPRHPVTLDRWEFDKSGGLQGLWQRWQETAVFIPISKLLHFTTTGMGKGNPEGVAVYEGGYTSWFYAKNLTILEAIICERLSGTPVIELPENIDLDDTGENSDLSRAKRIVRNIKTGDNMGLTLPFGWGFRYAMPAAGPAIDFNRTISRHQRDMARVLLMDFIMLGYGDAGSWAMIKDKSAMYLNALNAFLKRVAGIINKHAVPRLFALNALPEGSGLPEVFFEKLSKVDIGDFATVIGNLFNAGAMTYDMDTENEVRRRVGMSQIQEPGLLLKPNLPAQQPLQSPETVDVEKETDAAPQIPAAQAQLTEFGDVADAETGTEIADALGLRLVQAYDEILAGLPQDMAEADKDEWETIIAVYMANLAEAIKNILRDAMLALWNAETGDTPSIEALQAIVNLLVAQAAFVDNSLIPAISEAVLETRQTAEDDGLSEVFIAMAINGSLSSFRARTASYGGSLYVLFANFINAFKVKAAIDAKYSNNDIEIDWETGLLKGKGLRARYVGPNDSRSCSPCSRVVSQGWMPAERIPAIGTLVCNVNCRHMIQYKYRSLVI